MDVYTYITVVCQSNKTAGDKSMTEKVADSYVTSVAGTAATSRRAVRSARTTHISRSPTYINDIISTLYILYKHKREHK